MQSSWVRLLNARFSTDVSRTTEKRRDCFACPFSSNAVLRSLARRTAQQLQASAREEWKWNGRNVFIADGSHVSMPDTPKNQATYPQPPTQKPGLGFPLARITVLLSLATGACHDLAIAAYKGKGTGETTLLRRCTLALKPGDVVLADALYDNYFVAWELRQRGLELVARVQAERVGSQTVERRPDGDIIVWQRPNKPRGMTGEQYRSYPKTLLMRQVTVEARDKNNRAEQFRVITTILDAAIDGVQIGDLYERRWQGEVDIRSIKATMRMDILRCKTPEMVQKEIWAHMLAYNLLRTVMAVAASENHVAAPRDQLQGSQADIDRVRAKIGGGATPRACPAGGGTAGGGGVPPRGQPARTLGAAGAEAKAETLQAPGVSSPHRQTGAQSRDVVLARGTAVGQFLWLQAARAERGCSARGHWRSTVKRRVSGGQPRGERPTQRPATGSKKVRSQPLATDVRCTAASRVPSPPCTTLRPVLLLKLVPFVDQTDARLSDAPHVSN